MGYFLVFKFLLCLGAVQVASGVVFSPCELVREIEGEKVAHPDYLDFDYEKHISLVVCIAGYRRYNTSYQLTHPNGTGYYGIFGIHSSDMDKCFKKGDPRGPTADIDGLTNHVLYGDLRCLAHVVLASQATVDFYTKLCSPPFVNNVSCHLNNYVVATVFDPIQKDILERTFGTHDDPFLLLTSPPMNSTPTTIAQSFQDSSESSSSMLTSSHPNFRSFSPSSIIATATVWPETARLETLQSRQHSNPSNVAQTFTVFTCICVLLTILGFTSVKLINFMRRYRATRNTVCQEFRYNSESTEMMD